MDTNKMTSRRAVAPVIATLLLVAIAVVGGSIIFVFSQGFFSAAQVSGSPNIESIKILGYDASDGDSMIFHDGISTTTVLTGENTTDGLNAGEYVGVYLKNDSVNKIAVGELRVAGDIYTYVDVGGATLPNFNGTVAAGQYTIVAAGNGFVEAETINSSSASLESGQQVTIVFALEKDVKSGRDLQFKLQTATGSIFVSTINSGQQSG